MLEGFDVADWLKLDGGTDAPRVEAALHMLVSNDAETREQALSTLAATIHREGEPTQLSARVVPVLVGLLGTAEVPDKHGILGLLTELALGQAAGALAAAPLGELADVQAEEQSPGDPTPARRRGWTLAAVRDGTAAYLACLSHTDLRVRAAAAQLVGLVGHPPVTACDALVAHIVGERDAHAMASALIALGLRAAPAEVDTRPVAVLLEHGHDAAASMLVRLSGIIGLAYACPSVLSKTDRAMLDEAEFWPRIAADKWPWHGGDVGQLAVAAASYLYEAPAG